MPDASAAGKGATFPRAVAAALGAVLLWGAVPAATRHLVAAEAQAIAPLPLLGLRLGLSALAMMPFFLRARPWTWGRRDLMLIAFAAATGIVGYNLFITLGQVHIPAGVTALTCATEPLWILLLWSIMRRRPPSWPAVAGSVLGLFGILLLVRGSLAGASAVPQSAAGIGMVLLGAFCWSVYCVAAIGPIRRHGAIAVTATVVTVGWVPLMAMALPELPAAIPSLSSQTLGVIGFMALGSTVLATLAWNYAVGILPGPLSGQFLYGLPLVGVATGHLLLGEPLSYTLGLAALAIIAGLAIARKAG